MNNKTNSPDRGQRRALEFLDSIELPMPPRPKRGAAQPKPQSYKGTVKQALVVGSEIVSFVARVDPKLREAIVNCSLIAQLAANRKVPDRNDVRHWYEA